VKRIRRRVIPFRSAWHALACGIFLLFTLGLHAQQAPETAIEQPQVAGQQSPLVAETAAGSDAGATQAGAREIDAPPQSRPQTAPQSLNDPQPVNTPVQLTLHTRFKMYVHGTVSPVSLIGPAVGAGFGQWNNNPEQWGQGMAGYGRRFGSGVARNTIANTIAFGVAAIDHEDPRFMPSHESSILKRATHTVAGTFVTHTDRGNRIPAYSRFIGAYSASFIANTWYPESKATVGGGFQRGTTALLSTVAWRLLLEFGPDVWGRLHHRKD